MNTPFELAVRQHGDTVLRVCRTVLGPGADADDAWSETFLAALQAWPNLEEGTNLEAWLVRVAHNKAIDITRAHARRAVPTYDLPEQHSSIGNPEDAYSEVWESIAKLPQRQRWALAYHFIGSNADAVRLAPADGMKKLRLVYLPTPTERSAQ